MFNTKSNLKVLQTLDFENMQMQHQHPCGDITVARRRMWPLSVLAESHQYLFVVTCTLMTLAQWKLLIEHVQNQLTLILALSANYANKVFLTCRFHQY